jgi:protease I
MGKLDGKKVAIIATDGFEESELLSPKEALEKEGAIADVVAPKEGTIRAWHEKNWGAEVRVDRSIKGLNADEYDAVVLPGGVINADHLRMNEDAVRLVQEFFDAGKPIAAICHGPWTLIETGELEGRRLTSWPSLKTDVMNAGAEWADEEVLEDENLVTSRKPADLPAFNAKIIEVIASAGAPPQAVMDSMPAPRRSRPQPQKMEGVPRRPESGREAARRPSPRRRPGRS